MNPVRMFATSLDGSMIGDPIATEQFAESWDQVPARRRPLLVFNTGRLSDDVLTQIEEKKLPQADFLIAAVGTEIIDLANKRRLEAYERRISQGWNRDAVVEVAEQIPGIVLQPTIYQTPWKSSWYLDAASDEQIQDIQRQVKAQNLEVSVVYSNSRDLDFIPSFASKGRALAWLISHLGIDPSMVIVAGDRGSDRSMFELPGVRGILCDNAQADLVSATVGKTVFQSTKPFAHGLLDGLQHYGVLERNITTVLRALPNDKEMRLLLSSAAHKELSEKETTLIKEGYEQALDCIRRNITPPGFSACSLDDNEVVGTDVNYRSVWGRDAAITILNTLCANEPDILDCSRRSLETLLGCTTADGQVPANVRIADGVPDYSGVGGICAIDSAIWLVIAAHGYVQHTDDSEFLVRHKEKLMAIMRWLQAQDSNRDGLLEIPEAGDWTDLFGRSYNVLYDEILWYRAKVCWGQLLTRLGQDDDAIVHLRDSQHIRGRILRVFWPTTSDQEKIESTFADRQFSLGDARYLLAEVSPFSFNWRCDVLGNVLGFLFNVLDVPRARMALAFMWGVGVNQPWPVANLYPVVQSGDPDWRPYYTVNLLNLPHHYHNGGIWPFVGGLWVRFIHRLGQHTAAGHELARLADCNRQGRLHEWEFNEWCHGDTGRPMGKAFQAWSAATYISAYHELGFSEQACER